MTPNRAPLDVAYYRRPSAELAPDLLGCTLLTRIDGMETAGRIVEVEAYAPADPASHSYRGKTARNWAMFEPGGCAYVYRSYGVHWCFNVVAGDEGIGEGVLVRALEPIQGLDHMQRRHPKLQGTRTICRGPGRLAAALGISGALNGAPLTGPEAWLLPRDGVHPGALRTSRIGISVGREHLLRFVVPGSPYICRPRSVHHG